MMKTVYLEDVLLLLEQFMEQHPEAGYVLGPLRKEMNAIPPANALPADAWRYLELGHKPTAGVPVLIARRKNKSEPLRVEQAILLPSGKWKSFGHTFEPDNVIAWQPLAPAPELPEPVPF